MVFSAKIFIQSFIEKNKNKKIFLILIFVLILTALSQVIMFNTFCFIIPILIIVIFVYLKLKTKTLAFIDYFLFFSVLSVIYKVFFNFMFNGNYASYFSSITLITLIYFSLKLKKDINPLYYSFIAFLIFAISVMFFIDYSIIKSEFTNKITTPRGSVIYQKSYYTVFYPTIKYIYEKTTAKDTIIVLPEGAIINFLTNRKTDNYYNIFTPDRVEAFGEAKIIEHYKQTKPEYFIINNIEQTAYNKKVFCNYAPNVCYWIIDNYTLEYTVEGYSTIFILKRKDS